MNKFVDYDWQHFTVVEEISLEQLGLSSSSHLVGGDSGAQSYQPQIRDANTIGMMGVVPQQPQQIMAFDSSTGELVSLEEAGKHVAAATKAIGNDGGGGGPQKRPRDDGLASSAEQVNNFLGQ